MKFKPARKIYKLNKKLNKRKTYKDLNTSRFVDRKFLKNHYKIDHEHRIRNVIKISNNFNQNLDHEIENREQQEFRSTQSFASLQENSSNNKCHYHDKNNETNEVKIEKISILCSSIIDEFYDFFDIRKLSIYSKYFNFILF